MKTRIIAISGKAQHGKDTTAAILKELLEADGYRVLTVHYADLLKHICRSFFGWDGQKNAEQQAHPSETALDQTIPDHTIRNAGTLGDLTMALSDWVTAQNHAHQLSFSEVMAADGN